VIVYFLRTGTMVPDSFSLSRTRKNRMIDSKNFIFVTGFPRGGTSWLRNCIGTHKDVVRVPGELPILHLDSAAKIDAACNIAASELDPGSSYVSKAPADAPCIDKACRLLPASRFIFIIRDLRDVVVSHQRGASRWMTAGRNKSCSGILDKLEEYFAGYTRCQNAENVLLVKYEDLHQSFGLTYRKILEFLDLPHDDGVVRDVMKKNSFMNQTGRKHIEDRGAARRKGVIGDWAVHLKDSDVKAVQDHRFGSSFMNEHGYEWKKFSYETVLEAMASAGVHALSEDELLSATVDDASCSVALMHDVDILNHGMARESILETARIEGRAGFAALYNFLPIDDPRYRGFKNNDFTSLIAEIKAANPLAYIGLHLNASERLFPASEEKCEDQDDPRIGKTVEYLHEQVDRWESLGVHFRIGTAHGYGRGKKVPNNRDTPRYSEELKARGIMLYDTMIRPDLTRSASASASFTDVGESIRVRQMPTPGLITNPETYRDLPPGAFIRFLTHPGNYDVRKPMVMGFREDLMSLRVAAR
jgi:hypothetical protein